MKSLVLLFLLVATAIVTASAFSHLIGGIIGFVVGLVGLVFGVIVTVGATAFGLIVGGLGAFAAICFALLPVVIVLGLIALPFVLVALLVRALASRDRGRS